MVTKKQNALVIGHELAGGSNLMENDVKKILNFQRLYEHGLLEFLAHNSCPASPKK